MAETADARKEPEEGVKAHPESKTEAKEGGRTSGRGWFPMSYKEGFNQWVGATNPDLKISMNETYLTLVGKHHTGRCGAQSPLLYSLSPQVSSFARSHRNCGPNRDF